MLSSIVGFEVQPNKAIVGRNAFAHEAGIHQHGVINNPLCYEIMTPESVGVPANSLVLGKHSGRHALSLRYSELGYDITAAELDAAYRSFTNLADRKKRIYDQDLISLLSSATRARVETVVGAAAWGISNENQNYACSRWRDWTRSHCRSRTRARNSSCDSRLPIRVWRTRDWWCGDQKVRLSSAENDAGCVSRVWRGVARSCRVAGVWSNAAKSTTGSGAVVAAKRAWRVCELAASNCIPVNCGLFSGACGSRLRHWHSHRARAARRFVLRWAAGHWRWRRAQYNALLSRRDRAHRACRIRSCAQAAR